jgi:hypothetical protein
LPLLLLLLLMACVHSTPCAASLCHATACHSCLSCKPVSPTMTFTYNDLLIHIVAPVRSAPERATRSQSTWLNPFSSGTLFRRPSAATCTCSSCSGWPSTDGTPRGHHHCCKLLLTCAMSMQLAAYSCFEQHDAWDRNRCSTTVCASHLCRLASVDGPSACGASVHHC